MTREMNSEREEHDEASRVRSATDEDVERLGKLVIGVPVKLSGTAPPSWLLQKWKREQDSVDEAASFRAKPEEQSP